MGEVDKESESHIPEPFWLDRRVTCEATFDADEDMVEIYVGGFYLGSIKAKGISSEAQKEIGLHFM